MGEFEIFPASRSSLNDLQEFDRIWLIYFFDRSSPAKMRIVPYRDVVERGLFATRAPNRPNPVGITAVKVENIDETSGIITVMEVDMLDESPLIDIKPKSNEGKKIQKFRLMKPRLH
jgi:tRNA-Thr(GGU) m(6)t(6)A37 methyltransferase TsaA